MKRLLSVMMVLALFLPMISCGEPARALGPGTEEATKAYTVTLTVTDDQTTDAEGLPMAEYRYEIPEMRTVDGAPESVQAVAETFNGEMRALLAACMETGRQLGGWAQADPRVKGGSLYYIDQLTAVWREQGAVLCVTFQRYQDQMGPHPNITHTSRLFNLDRGCYVDPLELADDPETCRAAVEQQILAEIREDPELEAALYDNYADTVAQWNEACVSLEEDALAVTFSTYTLAPHAMGALSFRIPYGEAGLGEGGLALLGITE